VHDEVGREGGDRRLSPGEREGGVEPPEDLGTEQPLHLCLRQRGHRGEHSQPVGVVRRHTVEGEVPQALPLDHRRGLDRSGACELVTGAQQSSGDWEQRPEVARA